MSGLQMTRVAPAGFEPSPTQHSFARCLLDPSGPATYKDIADYIGCDLDKVEGWFQDPHFKAWLLYELDSRAGVMVGLVWRGIYQLAVDCHDPRIRLEAARMLLGRFDPGMRTGERDVARATAEFAKQLATETVKAAGPRAVHATIVR